MKKINIFKNNSLYYSFLRVTIITLLIVTTLISAIMYFYSQNMIYRDLTSYLYSAQSEMSKSMELVINDVNMVSVRLLSRPGLYQLINDKTISETDKKRLVREQFQSQIKESDLIGDAAIITYDGRIYKLSDDKYDTLPDKAFLDGIDKSNTVTYSDGISRGTNGDSYIMIGRRFRNLDTGEVNGYLIIYLKSNNLLKVYNQVLINNSFTIIVNKNGSIMSATDSTSIGKTIYDYNYEELDNKNLYHTNYKGESMVVASTSFSKQLKTIGFDWQILTYIKEQSVQSITNKISYNLLILESVSAVIAVISAFLAAAYILRPLKRLQSAMKGFKSLRHNVEVGNSRRKAYDEIWELEKAYVDMVYRIDELIAKNNEEKEKQRELELSALQAQINPHFLYNTLDAIVWLAKIKKEPEIEKITMALARFFRMSLHKGDKFITVQEEISLVQSFVVIEQMRFPNELKISYNISEDIMNIHILKLILQPVVENSLKHGIRTKKENGRIEINGMQYGDMIIFEVIDNGKGFNPHMLDEFDNLDRSKSGGYGLKNVDDRIKLEYGQKYGISIISAPDRGTTVIIKIGIKKL